MGEKHLRYRVGIDVGLYSDGLTAIEIDDSSDDPRDALPIRILSSMSVIHDGGVDPDNQKEADSRKAVSGVARRTRKMRHRKQKRLSNLDSVLRSLGYPVDQAIEISQGINSGYCLSYPTWNARIYAVRDYINNEYQRALSIAISLRHIARHRGWRNPYSSISNVKEASTKASSFYKEFVRKVQNWHFENTGKIVYPGITVTVDDKGNRTIDIPELLMCDPNRPTVAELIEPFLDAQKGVRFRKNALDLSFPTQIGKLHQSDYMHEILRIFKTQQVPQDHQEELLEVVFEQANPRDIGAAVKLVAFDDLPGQEKYPRASRASMAFQRYRILTTLTNLRIKNTVGEKRLLTKEEIEAVYEYLCVEGNENTTWHDVAAVLNISRNDLSGVGGQTQDGTPVSAKRPPILETNQVIIHESKKELKPLKSWWANSGDLEKEFFIEALDNAGDSKRELDEEESQAKTVVDLFLESLTDEALQKIESLTLASGRAAYSVNSLMKLNSFMLSEGVDLHTARKAIFDVSDSWKPAPNPLGAPTGNPAVDRTITIVSRWLKACCKRWGKPETVNIEHIREGFNSPKKANKERLAMDKRYKANNKIREEILRALNERDGSGLRGAEAIHHADIRRWQAIQRQNNQCIYCGAPITFDTAQMDHIVPRKGPGSSNALPNLVAACADCNKKKSNTLFYSWSEKPNPLKEVLERVDGWMPDSYFANRKEFDSYIKDVKARLLQKEEDDPIDVRSIESVAWMARELREQIEGFLGYQGSVVGHTSGNNDFELQRVNVYRGSLTAEARKASGIEKSLPWIGGSSKKERLDRRHHAVDAAVIALMRPKVGKVLAEREALRREQIDNNMSLKEQVEKYGHNFWKGFEGVTEEESDCYLLWRDIQMRRLKDILCQAMNNGKIIVSSYKRLRLGNGRVHKDMIYPLLKRKVGDALTPVNIDKVESSALWVALTSHSDYDPKEGLPEDWNRRIRLHDKWLDAYDEIGFMTLNEDDFYKQKDAVYLAVRGGFAEIGNAIHHARFYRIPKLNKKGVQTGWQFAYLRVFQADLLKHQREDLFQVVLPPQSISCRCATQKLRRSLIEGTAEYLGWVVVGDEIEINLEDTYFSPEKSNAINLFMRAFPNTKQFKVTGFSTNEQILLAPLIMSTEGLFSNMNDRNKDQNMVYGNFAWSDKEIKSINTILGIGGSFHPSVDVLLSTLPKIIRRNALGEERWKSNNHMPVSWKVTPHPKM